MEPEIMSHIDAYMKSLKESYQVTKQYSNAKEDDAYMKMVEKLCAVKQLARNMEKAKEKARTQQEHGNMAEVFERELQALNEVPYHAKKSKEYKDFRTYIKSSESQASNDAEEMVVESVENMCDPLSKLRIQEPVRNKHCGHHYDRDTIMKVIHVNHRLRCPVAGCINKTPIVADHLEEDEAFKRRLQATE